MSNTTVYEMMGILCPDRSNSDQEKTLKEIKSHVTALGGKVTLEDVWGMRDLAYRMRKFEQGYYFVWHIEIPSDKLEEFNEYLRYERVVLRYLITKVPKNYKKFDYKAMQKELEADPIAFRPQKKDIMLETIRANAGLNTPTNNRKPKVEKKEEEKTSDSKNDLDKKLEGIIDGDVA